MAAEDWLPLGVDPWIPYVPDEPPEEKKLSWIEQNKKSQEDGLS